jgi:hypothetical protein
VLQVSDSTRSSYLPGRLRQPSGNGIEYASDRPICHAHARYRGYTGGGLSRGKDRAMAPTPCTCGQFTHTRRQCTWPDDCTGCICGRHITVLVARDFGGYQHCLSPDIGSLVSDLGAAYVAHTSAQERCGSDNAERQTHRIQLDTRQMRPSHAHGLAYRYGFVAHIEAVQ